jgi:mono/diheme cytochrome c family protein
MSPEPKKPLTKAVEEAEPKAERNPAPVALIVLLAVLLYGAMIYLNNQSGGFNAKVYRPYSSIKEVEDAQPVAAGSAGIKQGEKAFGMYCAPCHQATGLGVPNQFPPLAGSEWVLAPKHDRIIRIVLNGFQGPVEVKGAQYNNAMPPWKDSLKDEDIANILSYVRQAWGNKADIVKPEEVKAIREATAQRAEPWTSPELQQIPDR